MVPNQIARRARRSSSCSRIFRRKLSEHVIHIHCRSARTRFLHALSVAIVKIRFHCVRHTIGRRTLPVFRIVGQRVPVDHRLVSARIVARATNSVRGGVHVRHRRVACQRHTAVRGHPHVPVGIVLEAPRIARVDDRVDPVHAVIAKALA
jgi:uncharacterized Zn-finger protein